jgi:hypothetical protein
MALRRAVRICSLIYLRFQASPASCTNFSPPVSLSYPEDGGRNLLRNIYTYRTTKFYIRKLTDAVMLITCVRKVSGSSLDHDINHHV